MPAPNRFIAPTRLVLPESIPPIAVVRCVDIAREKPLIVSFQALATSGAWPIAFRLSSASALHLIKYTTVYLFEFWPFIILHALDQSVNTRLCIHLDFLRILADFPECRFGYDPEFRPLIGGQLRQAPLGNSILKVRYPRLGIHRHLLGVGSHRPESYAGILCFLFAGSRRLLS